MKELLILPARLNKDGNYVTPINKMDATHVVLNAKCVKIAPENIVPEKWNSDYYNPERYNLFIIVPHIAYGDKFAIIKSEAVIETQLNQYFMNGDLYPEYDNSLYAVKNTLFEHYRWVRYCSAVELATTITTNKEASSFLTKKI